MGYSRGSYLGQIGADEPARVTTLHVELIESQPEHQFIEDRSGIYRVKACVKNKQTNKQHCCSNSSYASNCAAFILPIKTTLKFQDWFSLPV